MRLSALIAGLTLASTTSGLAQANPVHASTSPAVCDQSLMAFRPDAETRIVLIRHFEKGSRLSLAPTPEPQAPVADNGVCLVKLVVGPGNPGAANARSTSQGIGIEVWLPDHDKWNNRIHVLGGGGWAGGDHASPDKLAFMFPGFGPAFIATGEGAVSASTDTGHSVMDGSFGMLPDGSINTRLWEDFAVRGIHQMAVKTKALTRFYYGRDARWSYWEGFSTGGRQALKEAQANPSDFDGIISGAPAINWTRFITAELYPQLVIQRDLAGLGISDKLLDRASKAAIAACDTVGGVHLGYPVDPASCRYDPSQDQNILCQQDSGAQDADCLQPRQAIALNKIWFGQTRDGSVPAVRVSNGFTPNPQGKQLWFGPTRGTDLKMLAGAKPFPIATDLVAQELGDPRLATPTFSNAKANGADGWKALRYADLDKAGAAGLRLQPAFSYINTDNPDLRPLQRRGGKLIMFHGLADQLIPPQGSINYFERMTRAVGGRRAADKFSRFYLVPGMAHGFGNGTANPEALIPLPGPGQFYTMLTAWVEKGTQPGRIDLSVERNGLKRSRPLCPYPAAPRLTGADPYQSSSYECR